MSYKTKNTHALHGGDEFFCRVTLLTFDSSLVTIRVRVSNRQPRARLQSHSGLPCFRRLVIVSQPVWGAGRRRGVWAAGPQLAQSPWPSFGPRSGRAHGPTLGRPLARCRPGVLSSRALSVGSRSGGFNRCLVRPVRFYESGPDPVRAPYASARGCRLPGHRTWSRTACGPSARLLATSTRAWRLRVGPARGATPTTRLSGSHDTAGT
jgi:hypothetical protein